MADTFVLKFLVENGFHWPINFLFKSWCRKYFTSDLSVKALLPRLFLRTKSCC